MRTINADDLIIPIANKIKHALTHVDGKVLQKLKEAQSTETSPLCKWALGQIVENDEIAEIGRAHV